MNRQRRKRLVEAVHELNEAQEKLNYAKEIVDEVRDEEQESYDCLPEGIQDGERGDWMLENVDTLDEVYSELDTLSVSMGEQIEAIQEVIER